MFVVIYDPYGTLADAVCVSKGHETKEDAVVAMHELFDRDCINEKCDENYRDRLLRWSRDTYISTPRGYEDAMYKIVEI